ncbi:MAG: TonB-dependent receptor [Pedobacter sp.]|nr:MAG: TonB-dependent receptor [Pedobacter sp.]
MISNRVILFTILFINSFPLFAQITGKILTPNANPIVAAKVVLLDSLESEISATKSVENGTFIFFVKPSVFRVKIYALGFEIWESTPIIYSEKVTDIGNIFLKEQVYAMKEVEIKGAKSLFTQEIDKYIYSVQDDPDSKLSKAMDMLYKIPLIDIQGDRQIKVNGQSVKILVNGKPSILFKGNLETALKSMPADMLKSIEVMTNLSAKYSDQAVGSIINLVTKKKVFEGYTVYLGAYLTSLNNHVETVSATLKAGKFAYAGEYTYWWQKPPPYTFKTFRPNWSTIGAGQDKGIYTNGYNSISYELDTLNLFNFSIGFNHASDVSTSNDQNYQQLADSYIHQENSNSQFLKALSPSISLDYQRNFKVDPNRYYIISYRFDKDIGRDTSLFNRSDFIDYDFKREIALKYTNFSEQTLQIDYTKPFSQHGILEWGVKTILRDAINKNELGSITNENQYLIDPTVLNDFSYEQWVSSIYTTIANQYKSWSFRGGIRIEHTNDNNWYEFNANSYKRNYTHILPSLYLAKTMGNMNLSFSYSKRVARPGIYYLNPYLNLQNPYFIKQGNPFLIPENYHIYEVNLNKPGKIYLRTGVFYRYINHAIEPITNIENNVAKTTYENISQKHVFGSRLSADKRFKNWSTSLRLNMNYLSFINPLLNQQIAGVLWNPEFRINYSKKDVFRLNIQGGYNSSNPTAQGFAKGQFYNFILLGKDFLKNKLAVSFSGRNILLGHLNTRNSIEIDNLVQYTYAEIPQQEFKINLSYSFGKLKEGLKNTDKTISNQDIRNVKMSEVKSKN